MKIIKNGTKLSGNSKGYLIGDELFEIFSTGRIELIKKATIVKIGKRIKLENKEYVLIDNDNYES